ncbi:hypothetical protein [Parabacteroides sp.]|jgi:hypothetical protein|uniref:hypothetical protein n=1 Tax=Parabacteroides sp. TaxID=1869337 RepID=UPI001DD1D1BC|nr:hypothetical protein [Parabacteroides sp.]MBS5485495.1 hypothetical protein [Parabacteroides sp.]DAE61695.1 MAG TPA: hypothetical protein [Caudoviricetes sp.]
MIVGNRKKYNLVIGIDTGVHTGIATWNVASRKFELIATTSIHKAIMYVQSMFDTHGCKVLVRIEDARLRTWYQSNYKSRDEERKMLQGVGSVKRDAKIWEDFLTDIGIPFEMTHPKNSVTKLNDLSFRKLTKYNKRTSEHSRDAAMLVFGY